MQSAITPNLEWLKIDASGSVFTATIFFEFIHPARCWLAPEIPKVKYKVGLIHFPVNPTSWLVSIHSDSTAARDAPTAPLSRLASSLIFSNPSLLPIPLPPETTISASSSWIPSAFTFLVSIILNVF